jgi:serine/threonine protein kinase
MHRGCLFKIIARGGRKPLDPRLQRSIAISVARGMAYLHSRSPPLLHMDLKSPNILVDDKWRIKIADFGLSKVKRSTVLSTAAGGTAEWMAPEVLRSEPCDGIKADVYSYGVVSL